MKPAYLPPTLFTLFISAVSGPAWAQAPGAPPAAVDTEPAAAAPAAPPAPAEPAAADLPPPPPPRAVSAPPPTAGKVDIAAPPLPAAQARRGYHVHDGFYLRMGVGLGGGRIGVSTDSNSASNFSLGGGGLVLNAWFGGTPWPGIAIGGLVSLNTLRDSEASIDGNEFDENMTGSLSLLGVFLDAFPDPQRGLHFGGALALAGTSVDVEDNSLSAAGIDDYDGGGLGMSAWIGYMGFVGPEWSLGGMLQFNGAITVRERDDLKRQANAGAVSLSFSALFH